MSSIPELSTPDLWSKLSACLTAVGDHPGAADVYRSVARGTSMPAILPVNKRVFCSLSNGQHTDTAKGCQAGLLHVGMMKALEWVGGLTRK